MEAVLIQLRLALLIKHLQWYRHILAMGIPREMVRYMQKGRSHFLSKQYHLLYHLLIHSEVVGYMFKDHGSKCVFFLFTIHRMFINFFATSPD